MLLNTNTSVKKLLALGLATLLATASAQAEKYALIIANGDYDKEKIGWSPISSVNDVALIKNAALAQGFADEHVYVHKNITKQGFFQAFNELESKLTTKDMVWVHISSHGQQIQDDNGDELDGLDEAIVPIDAPISLEYDPTYRGQKHLRDDELGKMIQALRNKVGKDGQVMVVLDACHSGTATRGGNAKSRGTSQALWFTDKQVTNKSDANSPTGFLETGSSRGSSSGAGKLVVISGARADEQNFETLDDMGRDVGSLSYAFSKVMRKLDGETTYRSLFAEISVIMARKVPYQTPVIEGDMDVSLFNGNIIAPLPYFQILKKEGMNTVQINAGLASGIGKGSKLLVCKAGTLDPFKEKDKVIGEAVVSSAENFSATVELDDDVMIYNLKEAWLFMKEQHLNESKISVDLTDVVDPTMKQQLTAELNKISTVSICESGFGCDMTLVVPPGNSRGAGGSMVKTCDYSFPCDVTDNSSGCLSLIKEYSRANFIKSLDFYDAQHNISLDLVPADAEVIDGKVVVRKQYKLSDFSANGGIPEIPTNVQLLLHVKNNGTKPTYFSIIDIQPDGIINPILPYKDLMTKEECRLEPGESKIIPGYFVKLYPPYGLETFKVFSSENPIDLTPIITSRGNMAAHRGSMESLEQLLMESYVEKGATTRGGGLVYATNGGSGTAKNTVFRIVEPK